MNKKYDQLVYWPRTVSRGECQWWELRDHRGYRIEANVYPTDEVMTREREWNEWRLTPSGKRHGCPMVAFRYWAA